MKLTHSQRIVIKVGSSLLMDGANHCVNSKWQASLVDDIVNLSQQGMQVVLVSSGAIAFGKLALNLGRTKLPVDRQQASAAVGQIELMHSYQTLLKKHGVTAAQILLTLEDSENRKRYINLRNTLNNLLSMQVIPIINENDSVTTSEIRYGDNDRLAARVAQMIGADTLVLLSDIDGFYSKDPHKFNDAKFIPLVEELTPDIIAMGKESSTSYGSGGMITKLSAAKIAMSCGCRMLITAGKHLHPLQHHIDNNKGTWFKPQLSPQSAKKIWLKEHLSPSGFISIDDGAAQALLNGASLLSVGIIAINGQFEKGSAVTILRDGDKEIARGLSNYGHHELKQIMGKPSQDIVTVLGYEGSQEVVHRDNMVLFDA